MILIILFHLVKWAILCLATTTIPTEKNIAGLMKITSMLIGKMLEMLVSPAYFG